MTDIWIGLMSDDLLLFNADFTFEVIKGLHHSGGVKYHVDLLAKYLDEIEERGLTEEWRLYD